MRWSTVGKWGSLVLLGALAVGAGWLLVQEARSSRWQADWLSERARGLHFELGPGPSDAIRFPAAGPFDRRQGYQPLPGWIGRLGHEGFTVAAQARMSPDLLRLSDIGLFPPYREKTQVGLDLQDCRGTALFSARHPLRIYARFEAVPPLLVDTLLHIENRGLFDANPQHNPAIDWPRLGKAVLDQALHRLDGSRPASGGSTLATQIEKYRHSPGGRTAAPRDKLVQVASASLRSYLDGPDTRPRRQQIVLDYLNTVPLSARAGFGEVLGLGDALWAWYGRDFDEVNRLLQATGGAPPPAGQALAYKQALALLVSQRRPSFYLQAGGAADLRALTDRHLQLLADAGVIGPALRDAALPLALAPRDQPFPEPDRAYVDMKAATVLRGRLLGLLALPGAYDLDRIDLRAASSFDGAAQQRVSALLRSLARPEAARRAGLFGPYLLAEGDDPARIALSFTLFERVNGANLLRVQTDNLEQPLDLNEGTRLDLGSTAKLRTLITYLEQVAALHRRWAGLDAAQLRALAPDRPDTIARWAREYLLQAGDRGLRPMLDAAMQRTYSASPAEGFFTGGGLHRFQNFEARDDTLTMTVQEALTRSVNLVFIRLMRDVVRRVAAETPAIDEAVLADAAHPRRREILERFADHEGAVFVARFYDRYAPLDAQAAEARLLQGARAAPVPMANVFFMLEPEADAAALARFLARRLPAAAAQSAALHASEGPGRRTLGDRGYLAGVHPLALWVAAFLRQQPGATLAQTLLASTDARQQAYDWLFRTRRKSAQDRRIRESFETLAFAEIQRRWQRLGYPFEALTPSYASAIGAAGDRPSALAELMGIVVSRGLRQPVVRLQTLDFARGTPYETQMVRSVTAAPRVLDAEVADVARQALLGVVEDGTARRLKGAFVRPDGSVIDVGGKTGTGDHRQDHFGADGTLRSSRVLNRSATLVFLLGERHFGTVMAYVPEPWAVRYRFTSSLPTQILKTLAPALLPLLEGAGCAAPAPAPRSAAADGAAVHARR